MFRQSKATDPMSRNHTHTLLCVDTLMCNIKVLDLHYTLVFSLSYEYDSVVVLQNKNQNTFLKCLTPHDCCIF